MMCQPAGILAVSLQQNQLIGEFIISRGHNGGQQTIVLGLIEGSSVAGDQSRCLKLFQPVSESEFEKMSALFHLADIH